MKPLVCLVVSSLVFGATPVWAQAARAPSASPYDRTVLPIAPPARVIEKAERERQEQEAHPVDLRLDDEQDPVERVEGKREGEGGGKGADEAGEPAGCGLPDAHHAPFSRK